VGNHPGTDAPPLGKEGILPFYDPLCKATKAGSTRSFNNSMKKISSRDTPIGGELFGTMR